jgi:hypothetical protein
MTNSSIAPPPTEENKAIWAKVPSVFEGGDVEEALSNFIRVIGGDWAKVPEPTRQALRANAWTIYANSKLPDEEVSCQSGGGWPCLSYCSRARKRRLATQKRLTDLRSV